MTTITVRQYDEATLVLNEDWQFVCDHTDAYIEAACCSGRDSDGNPSCACNGQDAVICPAIDCTGIEDHEIDALFERLRPEPDYDDRGYDE